MEKNNILTVYILTYNRCNYLKRSIESVLAQTYSDFQIVILDNASTDNTQRIVETFNDKRIKYIKHHRNIGGLENINYAIQNCNTKYFVIFHDDDIMNNNMLDRLLNEMENNEEYTIISSECMYINTEEKEINFIKKKDNPSKRIFTGNMYLKNYILDKNGVVCPSVMYRNSFIKETELLYRLDIGPAADQYMWFEIERKGGVICCINECLMKYRLHENQDSLINSHSMVVDLYRALNCSSEYNLILQKFQQVIEIKFLRIVISMGKKYSNNEITLDRYLKYINIIINEFCKRKLIIFMIKVIKSVAITFPNLYRIVFATFKKLVVDRRR